MHIFPNPVIVHEIMNKLVNKRSKPNSVVDRAVWYLGILVIPWYGNKTIPV